MAFGITPAGGFPPASDDGFPRFLQFQQDGIDVGTTIVETVNLIGAAELSVSSDGGTLTIDVSGGAVDSEILVQEDGVNVGVVDTLNFTGNVNLALTEASTVEINVPTIGFTWRDVAGDDTLVLADAEDGIATVDGVGLQDITVPPDASVPFAVGASVLVYQEGAAQARILAGAGVTLRFNVAFNPYTAAQFSVLTLIKRAADLWLVCGDMESA